jgi:hypothetical protein
VVVAHGLWRDRRLSSPCCPSSRARPAVAPVASMDISTVGPRCPKVPARRCQRSHCRQAPTALLFSSPSFYRSPPSLFSPLSLPTSALELVLTVGQPMLVVAA